MAAPRWIFMAFLFYLTLGLSSAYRPLADENVTMSADTNAEEKNGAMSKNELEGDVVVVTGCGTNDCIGIPVPPYHYEPIPPKGCGSCEEPPIEVEPCLPPLPPAVVLPPIPPVVLPPIPPFVLPPIPPVVVPPINFGGDCPVPQPCMECEQNENEPEQQLG